MFSILSLHSMHSSNVERQRSLAIELLSLGVTSPLFIPVTELDLGLFFPFTRLCPRVSPLYTHFVITIYYYQLYFVKCVPWKRQNDLCNDFSSIKFTIDFASHVHMFMKLILLLNCMNGKNIATTTTKISYKMNICNMLVTVKVNSCSAHSKTLLW